MGISPSHLDWDTVGKVSAHHRKYIRWAAMEVERCSVGQHGNIEIRDEGDSLLTKKRRRYKITNQGCVFEMSVCKLNNPAVTGVVAGASNKPRCWMEDELLGRMYVEGPRRIKKW